MSDQKPTLVDDLRKEEEAMRRRWIHYTRPQRPLSLEEAMELAQRMAAVGQGAKET